LVNLTLLDRSASSGPQVLLASAAVCRPTPALSQGGVNINSKVVLSFHDACIFPLVNTDSRNFLHIVLRIDLTTHIIANMPMKNPFKKTTAVVETQEIARDGAEGGIQQEKVQGTKPGDSPEPMEYQLSGMLPCQTFYTRRNPRDITMGVTADITQKSAIMASIFL
jgi:hypothetical protein